MYNDVYIEVPGSVAADGVTSGTEVSQPSAAASSVGKPTSKIAQLQASE